MSRFLSYGGWSCWHEQAIYLRRIEDLKTILAWPQIGLVETAMAPGWRLFHYYNPGINAVVVRRPIPEVMKSMLSTDLHGYATYDVPRLEKVMAYGDRMLEEISKELPGCMTIEFDELSTEVGCKSLFEKCLPFEFDKDWWEKWSAENVQVDVASYIRYYHENRSEIDGFKKTCWRELRRLRALGEITKH